MATKIKFFKGGFKYISQIFDEEKEEEMQIGLPTDVKHVAHIGGNGPSAEAPSWMKDFKSAPLAGPTTDNMEEKPDIEWVSEDTKPKRAKEGSDSESSSRGKSSAKKERSRQHRRHHSTSGASDSSDVAAARNLPDIPKKSRRKKSKEEAGGSNKSKTKVNATTSGSSNSDHGAEAEHALPPLSGHNSSTKDGEN